MSIESAAEFFTVIMEDDDILDLVVRKTDGTEGRARTQAFVSAGAEQGFDFTPEEAVAAQDAIDRTGRVGSDDLSGLARRHGRT